MSNKASKLIVANWKMNGSVELINSFDSFFSNIAFPHHEVVMCVPYPYISFLKGKNYFIGAQDCYEEKNGAYTGCVSAAMLKELNVRYVILGHSERRKYFSEDDAVIEKKFKCVSNEGLIPIVCVGETKTERDGGLMLDIIEQQLSFYKNVADEFIIAYEPLWSIGSGKIPKISEIEEVLEFIKQKTYCSKVLYGGSVNSNNVESLINSCHIDGLLVGGASLLVEQFSKIIKI